MDPQPLPPPPERPRARTAPRLQTLATNLRCNQNCTYCNRRAEVDDRAAIAPRALQVAMLRALGAGTEEIRLTGGEPTLRRDLADLVRFARQQGALRVSLETNATAIDLPRAEALAAAGLTSARVNLAGPDARLDAITRDDGGFARTIAGIRALLSAGLAVDITAALTRSTVALLSEMPAALLAAVADVGRPVSIEVHVPTEAPQPEELLTYPDAAEALLTLDRACRALALPLRRAPDSGPPPCLFPPRRGLPHLYGLSPGTHKLARHAQVATCADCIVADRCSGLPTSYLRHFGPPALHPIVDEKARRRLSNQRPLPEQIAHELVTTSLSAGPDGEPAYDEIVRINFHCNQACAFCFVSTHLPPATDAAIEAAIRGAAARGARIVLSGGEPTLNPRLIAWIQLARAVSTRSVCLQTNAVRLDDPKLCSAVVAAGVSEAFVSLHGATAEVCDAVTDTPGTFVRTLVGIDNLAAAGVEVVINYVLCEANQGEFQAFVQLVADRWPRALANYSFVAPSTDLVPKEKRLIPRYSDVLPHLAAGLRLAAARGVRVVGFESMCGIPLCLIPQPFDRAQLQLLAIPEGSDEGEFLKPPVCAGCSLNAQCYGVRRRYAELHGVDELRAVP